MPASMDTEKEKTEKTKPQEEEFTVVFKNGALQQLKRLAKDLNVSEDRLGDVIRKSMNVIDMAKDGSTVTIKKGKEEYAIDLRII